MIENVWKQVLSRSPAKLRNQIPAARAFLSTLDTPHAKVLCGLQSIDRPTEKSASDLAALLVNHVDQSETDKWTAAEWLKIYGIAVREYNLIAKEQIPAPPRPIVIEPQPSPFGDKFDADIRKANVLVAALHKAIAKGPSTMAAGDLLGAIALSAVVHGMLLDSVRLKLFVERLTQGTPPELSFDNCSVLFELSSAHFGKRQDVRWYLDPVTELLVWQFLKLKPRARENLPEKPLQSFRKTFLPKQTNLPVGFHSVVNAFSSWWLLHSSPTDIACARRRISWYSIDPRSYNRLFRDERFLTVDSQKTPAKSGSGIRHEETTDDSFESADVELLSPWFIEAQEMLLKDGATTDTALDEVSSLRGRWGADPQANVFLQWLSSILVKRSSRGKKPELKTVAQWFITSATYLLAVLGGSNPAEMGSEDLVDLYGELMTDPALHVQRQAMANGLQHFHQFLVAEFGLKAVTLKNLFSASETQRSVDANLINHDDYQATCSQIDGLYKLSPQDRLACRLVLMLGFRCGMRRMEIFGLRLQDIHLGRTNIDILVTPNDFRRLKTKSSKRRVPAHALFSGEDRVLFRQYVRARRDGRDLVELDDDEFLFPDVTIEDGCQPWIDRIVKNVIDSLRTATGDDRIFLHHLRHSFGTWTYLALRCAEVPAAALCLNRFPQTKGFLRRAQRTRRLLLGNPNLGSRSVGFAVSRLLGHSSPSMSFGHYIHSADFIGFGLAYRYCETLHNSVLKGASRYKRSATYKYRSMSLADLLQVARQKLAPPDLLIPPKPKGRGPGRPPKTDALNPSVWLSNDRLQTALEMLGKSDLDMSTVAHQTQLSQDALAQISASALKYGRHFGVEATGNGRIRIKGSLTLRMQEADAFLKEMSGLLEKLGTSDPVLCRRGVETILNHYDHDKHDCIFRGDKDRNSLLELTKFLGKLGFDPARFCWVLRTYEDQPSLPQWAQSMKLKWHPTAVRRINPKNQTGASSYAQWIGISPHDQEGRTLGRASALAAFFALIYFSLG